MNNFENHDDLNKKCPAHYKFIPTLAIERFQVNQIAAIGDSLFSDTYILLGNRTVTIIPTNMSFQFISSKVTQG